MSVWHLHNSDHLAAISLVVVQSLGRVQLFLTPRTLPASSVHGISKAGTLQRVAISFSRGSSQLRDRTCISYLAGGFFIAEPPGKPCRFLTVPEKWLHRLEAEAGNGAEQPSCTQTERSQTGPSGMAEHQNSQQFR